MASKAAAVRVLILLFVPVLLFAQTVRISGTVVDPSGAVIPSADIKAFIDNGLVNEGRADNVGAFTLELPAGEYRLEVSVPGFNVSRQQVRVTPSLAPLRIRMTLAAVTTTVGVETAANQPVSLESQATLTATTLTNETIQALPDDEDQLLAQLQLIASASGTQGAATLVVDGFTGGRVPSRDQIQQIIVESNSFSAESSGGPRIQIITRPGTGPWTGNFNIGFQNEALNAKNPFDVNKPARRQHIFQTTYGGPVIPGKLTLRLNARTVETEAEANSVRAITLTGPVNQGVFSPTINRNGALSGQYYLNSVHTFNFTGNYNTNSAKNQGAGGFSLPERALNFKGHNWNVQLGERAIINPRFISELRFFFFHNQNSLLPASEGVAVNVLDAFNGGGAQNRTRRRNTNINFGNTIRWTVRPTLNLQIGSDFTYTEGYSNSETNYLGVFTFSSLADYAAGRPVTFRKTIGNPILEVNQLDGALFIQADWRMNPKWNLGAGARYQAQTNLRDYDNVTPTFQVAYQPRTGTVVRLGGRLTYQTFNLGNTEQLLRQNGTNQSEIVITNPSYPDALLGGGTVVTSTSGSIRSKHPDLRAPYTANSALTVEQDLKKGWRISTSFDVNKGVHLIRTRNTNAPFPGTPLSSDLLSRLSSFNTVIQAAAREELDRMRPLYPFTGNLLQFESAGSSYSKNLNVRVFLPGTFKLYRIGLTGMVQYTLGWADDDASAVNQYDWRAEWSLAANDARHRMQSSLNVTLPWQTSISLLMFANSGRPYSITTGKDENGDQSTNDRPAGYTRNSATGPGSYNIDAQFTKTIALRKLLSPRAGNNAVPQIAVPPPPASGGATPTGARLSIVLSVRNLLNNTQLRGYSGVVTSPLFGKPTGTAPGRNMSAGLTVNW